MMISYLLVALVSSFQVDADQCVAEGVVLYEVQGRVQGLVRQLLELGRQLGKDR